MYVISCPIVFLNRPNRCVLPLPGSPVMTIEAPFAPIRTCVSSDRTARNATWLIDGTSAGISFHGEPKAESPNGFNWTGMRTFALTGIVIEHRSRHSKFPSHPSRIFLFLRREGQPHGHAGSTGLFARAATAGRPHRKSLWGVREFGLLAETIECHGRPR